MGQSRPFKANHPTVSIPITLAATGSGGRGLSHPRAAEDTAGDESGRDAAPAGGRQQYSDALEADGRCLRAGRQQVRVELVARLTKILDNGVASTNIENRREGGPCLI